MGDDFRLHHGSATTEKAAQAAGRVEVIVADVVNGNRKAWGRIDVGDIALLVQHARDAAASPDWLSKMAIDTLVTHGAAAEQRATAAEQRAEAAEARAAQAEADARLMLAAYYGADSASIARFGLGDGLLSEGDLQRLDSLRGATFYASEGETAAAMLRILATSGA